MRGAGGLVTALRPLVERHDVTWIASAMGEAERELARRAHARACGDGAAVPAPARRARSEGVPLFYDVVANPVLWFVQHGLWELKHDPDADLTGPWRRATSRSTGRSPGAAVEELDRDPTQPLFVQDYHLYLVPRLVRRERRPRASRSSSTSPGSGRGLVGAAPAIARAVHEGLLAYDSVGFHTERWREAFVECCEALLGAR